jgi:hypothetical protein
MRFRVNAFQNKSLARVCLLDFSALSLGYRVSAVRRIEETSLTRWRFRAFERRRNGSVPQTTRQRLIVTVEPDFCILSEHGVLHQKQAHKRGFRVERLPQAQVWRMGRHTGDAGNSGSRLFLDRGKSGQLASFQRRIPMVGFQLILRHRLIRKRERPCRVSHSANAAPRFDFLPKPSFIFPAAQPGFLAYLQSFGQLEPPPQPYRQSPYERKARLCHPLPPTATFNSWTE